VDEALKSVGMYEYKDKSPHNLSGGQKQRVAIAGILAMRPNIIVLDEPTAMLDPKGRADVMKTIKHLNTAFNITVVLITHNMDEAAQADRVIVLEKGKIILDGTPKNVFSQYEVLKKTGLDVPQITALAYELNKEGFNIDKCVLTVEEFVAELKKYDPLYSHKV
jgi:energy-coupling factor transport system ATP-binding protein